MLVWMCFFPIFHMLAWRPTMSQWNEREEVERLKAMFLEAAAGEAERVARLLAERADEEL